MRYDDIESRKRLTFAQAEGIDPLPRQLERSAMPNVLRAQLWEVVLAELDSDKTYALGDVSIGARWRLILGREHVDRQGKMPETFTSAYYKQITALSGFFQKSTSVEIYDFLQFVLRRKECPAQLKRSIENVLGSQRAAYRLVDGNTFVPVGSDEELSALKLAFSTLSQEHGARTHLRHAAEHLSAGRYADSVRDSIHAVEAVARSLEPSAELSKALVKLENSNSIHGAMKKGFLALYGYASDEQGIRHPLLDDGDAKVDEADAMFMIGACASFVTYLLRKRGE